MYALGSNWESSVQIAFARESTVFRWEYAGVKWVLCMMVIGLFFGYENTPAHPLFFRGEQACFVRAFGFGRSSRSCIRW